MIICTQYRSNAASSRLNEDLNASLHICIILYNLMPHKFIKLKWIRAVHHRFTGKPSSLLGCRYEMSIIFLPWMMTLVGKALTRLNDTWHHQLQCNVNICLFWVLHTFYILHLHHRSHQGWELIRDILISSHFIVLIPFPLKWILTLIPAWIK